jgi:capsular polysaccharide biosynthesis protein
MEPGLLPVVRRHWRLIAIVTAACALAGAIFATTAKKTYEAETDLLVGPVDADYATLQASGQLGRTYAELAASERVVVPAAHGAGVNLPPKKAVDKVSATSNEITRIVTIRVRNGDPRAAARMANGLAASLIELRRTLPPQPSAPVDALLREPELVGMRRSERAAVRRAAARVLTRTNAGVLQVIDRAEPPSGAVAPRVPLIVLLAAVAGALAAFAFAIVRDGLRRERVLDELEAPDLLDGYVARETAPREVEVDEWLGEKRRAESS